jgi:S-adenosylmethionine hydrolase
MNIITLTSDLGYRDPYLALVKAKLLSGPVKPSLIDLSCDLKSNSIIHASFILKNALPAFPDGTIHLAAIKVMASRSGLNKEMTADNSRFLMAKYQNQYIVCPDNGLLALIDENIQNDIYQIYYEGEHKQHFFLKDVFADVALHVLEGKPLADIATPTNEFYRATQFDSYVNGNLLRGKGIYVDDFGNIICNITREKFYTVVGNKNFRIALPGAALTQISQTYEEVKYGSALVLFNSFGYLEVAVHGGSAYKMLCPRDIGATFDFNLIVEFYD